MNILKPQKIFLNNLVETDEFKSEDIIENAKIENKIFDDLQVYKVEFEKVIFNNVCIQNGK